MVKVSEGGEFFFSSLISASSSAVVSGAEAGVAGAFPSAILRASSSVNPYTLTKIVTACSLVI